MPAAAGGEGRQDSCSIGSMASADQHDEQIGEVQQNAGAHTDEGSALSGELMLPEPVEPRGPAVTAAAQVALEEEATIKGPEAESPGKAAAVAMAIAPAGGPAATAHEEEQDADPAVHLAGDDGPQPAAHEAPHPQVGAGMRQSTACHACLVSFVVLAQFGSDDILTCIKALHCLDLQVASGNLTMPQPMEIEAPDGGEPKPAPTAVPSPSAEAHKITASQPVAPAVPRPPVLRCVVQPKQALPAKATGPSAATKPATDFSAMPTAVAAALKPAGLGPMLKVTAAPAPSLAKFVLPGASGSGSLLPKALQLGSNAAGLKAPTSRMGQQPPAVAGPSLASRPAPSGTGLLLKTGLAKPTAPASGPALPAMQKKALPVPALRPPVLTAVQNRQAPAAGQAGTPLSALPKHVPAAPAAQQVKGDWQALFV